MEHQPELCKIQPVTNSKRHQPGCRKPRSCVGLLTIRIASIRHPEASSRPKDASRQWQRKRFKPKILSCRANQQCKIADASCPIKIALLKLVYATEATAIDVSRYHDVLPRRVPPVLCSRNKAEGKQGQKLPNSRKRTAVPGSFWQESRQKNTKLNLQLLEGKDSPEHLKNVPAGELRTYFSLPPRVLTALLCAASEVHSKQGTKQLQMDIWHRSLHERKLTCQLSSAYSRQA